MAHSSVFVSERIDDDNEARIKRARRDQSSVTGKNIVVLRRQDVVRRGDIVLMPNTIEMACIKKPGTGQFKTNVEISSIMSEDDVKERLERTFPLLTGQRFCCAAAADSRTRLEFHGRPRLWNGRSIKKWIKGNSALYILTEVMLDMPGTLELSFNNMNGNKDNNTELSQRRTHPDYMRLTCLTDSVKVPVSQTLESDSGVETADDISLCSVSSQATGMSDLTYFRKYKSLKKVEEEQMEMPILEREFGEADGDRLLQLSVVASKIRSSITKKPSIVRDICPRSSPVKGGSKFYIILEECLPRNVSFGHAFFGSFGRATLKPVNGYTLTGTIPPAQSPGIVTVIVKTSEAQYLGESLFEYVDDMLNMVRSLVRNPRLQMQFHHLMNHELGKLVEAAETGDYPNPERSGLSPGAFENMNHLPQIISQQPEYATNGHEQQPRSQFSELGFSENDIDYYCDAESTSRESGSSAEEEDGFHSAEIGYDGDAESTSREPGSSAEEEDGFHSADAKVWTTMPTDPPDDGKDHFSDRVSLFNGSLDYSSRDVNAAGNTYNLFSSKSLGNSAILGDTGKRCAKEGKESFTEKKNIKSVFCSLPSDRFSSPSCASGSGQKLQLNSYHSDNGSVLVLPSAEKRDFDWQSTDKHGRSIGQTQDYHQNLSQQSASSYLDPVYQQTGRKMTVQETCNVCENPKDRANNTEYQDCSDMPSPRLKKNQAGTRDLTADCVSQKPEQREEVGVKVNRVCHDRSPEFRILEYEHTEETEPSNLSFSQSPDYLDLQQWLEEEPGDRLLNQSEEPQPDIEEMTFPDEQRMSDRVREIEIQLQNTTLDDGQSCRADKTNDSQCGSGDQDQGSSGFDGEGLV